MTPPPPPRPPARPSGDAAVLPSQEERAPLPRWWFPQPINAIYSRLTDRERELLQTTTLDRAITAYILDAAWPVDLLTTPAGRMRALRAYLGTATVLTGEGALWVHLGGTCPPHLTACSPMRRGGGPFTTVFRANLPSADVTTIAGRQVTGLERTVVDLARTAHPTRAVEAVLAARSHGISAQALAASLERCRGSHATGRPRARSIIAQVYDLSFTRTRQIVDTRQSASRLILPR